MANTEKLEEIIKKHIVIIPILKNIALTGLTVLVMVSCNYKKDINSVGKTKYDSLETKHNYLQAKYDSLENELDWWIKKYADCERERTNELVGKIEDYFSGSGQKKEKELKKETLSEDYLDKEKEDIKKRVFEEFNK